MYELRALVVDDSKVGRLTMMKKLEAMGVKVELAESGQQALDYLAQHRPDMIFMDHMMPEMDGFEVTRRIKASPATWEIPVIIISGNDEATFVEEARAAGAIDAIAKPPATEVLETLLASLPKLRAEAAVAVGAEPPPQPAAAERAPAPSMDMAEMQALIERMVGAAVTPLRDGFMAELGQRLDQQAAAMAVLERGLADADMLGNRLRALEQRLLPLEAKAGRLLPDFDAMQAELEQRLERHIAQMRETVSAAESAAAPVPEAVGEGSGSKASAELQAIQAELGELRERLSESRLHQLVGETLGSLQPAADAERVVAEPEAPPVGSASLQVELAQLRRKVKALAIATAVGGALLLAVIGMAVFGG